MIQPRLKHFIGTILLATLALTSCASPPLPDNIDKLPYSKLENRKIGKWSSAEIIDDNHIRIILKTTGAPDCYRDETEVVETPTTITVTAFHGWIPHSDRLCPGAMFYGTDTVTMIVETETPINGREIIDGGSKIYAQIAEGRERVKSGQP